MVPNETKEAVRLEDGRLSWYGHLPRTAARRRT